MWGVISAKIILQILLWRSCTCKLSKSVTFTSEWNLKHNYRSWSNTTEFKEFCKTKLDGTEQSLKQQSRKWTLTADPNQLCCLNFCSGSIGTKWDLVNIKFSIWIYQYSFILIRAVPSRGELWGGGQLSPLEIQQSDYKALIRVISAPPPPPEIRETISALPSAQRIWGTALMMRV